jgi:hypothetical protein
MIRHWFLLGLASLTGTAYDQRSSIRSRGEGGTDRNVILVVSDGLRWQEVFTGADSAILFGDPSSLGGNAQVVRDKYWRASAEERRNALMPFLWGTVARRGELLGNRTIDSWVEVQNPMKFSYPGYNEMLVGAPDARIDRNDFGPNPNVTVFEWLNRRQDFKGRVAAFGTWDVFHDIFNVERSRIRMFTNGSKPHDQLVQDGVLPFLRQEAPRALFVGFAETDDWGHEGRYDRFLAAVHAVDRYLEELWSTVQSHPKYRGRTTLIFTADHGRGRAPTEWRHHGRDVAGSDETFIIAIGPDVAARGERKGSRHALGDVARATSAAVGLKYRVEQPTRKN